MRRYNRCMTPEVLSSRVTIFAARVWARLCECKLHNRSPKHSKIRQIRRDCIAPGLKRHFHIFLNFSKIRTPFFKFFYCLKTCVTGFKSSMFTRFWTAEYFLMKGASEHFKEPLEISLFLRKNFFRWNFEKYTQIFFYLKRLKNIQRTHKSDGDLSEANCRENTLQEVSKYEMSDLASFTMHVGRPWQGESKKT